MNGPTVDYAPFLKPTQDWLIKLLQSKLPAVTSVASSPMKLEVFVPKSNMKCNQIDNGLYLLNILQNYKGDKRNSVITINTEAQVKRFALRVCHQITTCSENSFRVSVEKDALQLSSCLMVLPSDKELVSCVGRRAKADRYEDLVATPWLAATRDALQSLTSRSFLMDMIIDLVGVKRTLGKTNILYLPTTVFAAKHDTNPQIWGNYMNDQYTPPDGSCIDLVFIPLHCKKRLHWWACICDIKKKKNYILDSCMKIQVDPHNHHASEILFNVGTILGQSYKSLEFIYLNDIENLEVPQQKTNYDCGVFLLKWLSALEDESLWKDDEYYEDLTQYRKSIMLELLKWDKNTKRFSLVKKAAKK